MNQKTKKSPGVRQRIRVLIADDSKQFCVAVSFLLGHLPQVELVGIAGDGEQALDLTVRTQPDLVLMDLNMPGRNGLEVTRQLHIGFPEVRVIIITLHDSSELKTASLAAGADGFIPKQSLRKELPVALARLFPLRAGKTPKTRKISPDLNPATKK